MNPDRALLQQLFIRICRDSGFQLDVYRACSLAAATAGRSPLEVWAAFPGLNVMSEIAKGDHPAAHRAASAMSGSAQDAQRLGPKDASAVRDSGDAQPQSSTGAGQ